MTYLPNNSASQKPVGQMGPTSTAAASLWAPFAGKGQKGRHVGWLLDGLGHRADDLRRDVEARFAQRAIPKVGYKAEVLTARGIAVEQRPFYVFNRGAATIALYIAQLGKDLYISQATFALGALGTVRMVIAGVLALLSFVSCCLLPLLTYASVQSLSSTNVDLFSGRNPLGGIISTLAQITCCFGPVGFVSSVLVVLGIWFSIYKGLTDRDPLAILRDPINDFQQDDIIALEKAVEQTVRQSMDAVGIDSKLMPPAIEYGVRRRVI